MTDSQKTTLPTPDWCATFGVDAPELARIEMLLRDHEPRELALMVVRMMDRQETRGQVIAISDE